MEGDSKTKLVHQNLLLPLFSNPSDHTNKSDTASMVDQTVNIHGVIAASTVTSHVQDMSPYSKAWVADMFQKGLLPQLVQQFVTTLFE